MMCDYRDIIRRDWHGMLDQQALSLNLPLHLVCADSDGSGSMTYNEFLKRVCFAENDSTSDAGLEPRAQQSQNPF
jgi:hypothetical protein